MQIHLSPYRVRMQVVSAVRSFFTERGFLELQTPLLIPAPSTEPFLEVFETTLHLSSGKKQRMFLPTSPEFAIKKLLAQGVGSCFEITKSFRNGEEITARHHPEFSILEWYHSPGTYLDVMEDTEALFQAIYSSLWPQKTEFLLSYQGNIYDLSSGWERLSVRESFERYLNLDVDTLLSSKLIDVAREKGYSVTEKTTWEEAYTQLLLNEIEPYLGKSRPTFLYDYPVSQAAFSKKSEKDPRFAERFELYLAGWELGNAFTELTDAQEQRKRCLEDLDLRRRLGKTEIPLDEEFLQALEQGLPPTGGVAMGLDRIAALFADVADIHEVMIA